MSDAPPHIVAKPTPRTAPEEEARALRARCWRFVFDAYFARATKSPAAGPSERGEDGTETKEDSADGTSIHN
jgi:hypothetical protein